MAGDWGCRERTWTDGWRWCERTRLTLTRLASWRVSLSWGSWSRLAIHGWLSTCCRDMRWCGSMCNIFSTRFCKVRNSNRQFINSAVSRTLYTSLPAQLITISTSLGSSQSRCNYSMKTSNTNIHYCLYCWCLMHYFILKRLINYIICTTYA